MHTLNQTLNINLLFNFVCIKCLNLQKISKSESLAQKYFTLALSMKTKINIKFLWNIRQYKTVNIYLSFNKKKTKTILFSE